MEFNESVSLEKQTMLAFIPFVNIYAAYKVKKTQYFVIIVYLGVVAINTGLSLVLEREFVFPINMAIGILLSVYFIRYFSKQWNEKFENSTESS